MHYYTVSLPGNIPPSEVDDLVRGWRQSSAISFSFGGARLVLLFLKTRLLDILSQILLRMLPSHAIGAVQAAELVSKTM